MGDASIRQAAIATLTFIVLMSVAGCVRTSPADRQKMMSDLRSELPKIEEAASLALEAYSPTCPQPTRSSVQIRCFIVSIANRPKDYIGSYLIKTDEQARKQTIAFRGTDNLDDDWTDAMTQRNRDSILDTDDHSGFRSIAQTIYADIKTHNRIDPRYQVSLTGHSLGGAVAVLVALYMNYEMPGAYKIDRVYTFGQPKIFTNEAVSAWGNGFGEKILRVVNCDDPVPIVPTDDAWFGNIVKINLFSGYRMSDYQQLGKSVVLFDNGRYWIPGQVDFERDLYKSSRDLIVNAVQGRTIDHGMKQYQIRLAQIPPSAATVMEHPPAYDNFPCSNVAPSRMARNLLRIGDTALR